MLDGDNDLLPGGNYVHTFNVSNGAARVVSLPDLVRGAGQSVDLTPDDGADDPLTVRISDGSAVTSLQLDLKFDPTLLAILGASRAIGVPADWAVNLNELEPGLVRVSAAGTTALSGSDVPVVSLTAAVPVDASYGAAHVIELQDLEVNNDAIAAVADDAIHKVIYPGDASGNFGYSGLDAALVLRVGHGPDTGFDAYPLIDPILIGDLTGDGTLDDLDAQYVAEKSVGLVRAEVPDIPVGVTPGLFHGPDPIVSIASGLYSGSLGEQVSLLVEIDEALGLLGANLELGYDSAILDLANGDLSIPEGAAEFLEDWDFAVNVDDQTGEVRLAIYDIAPHAAGGGTLATLEFEIAASAALGTTPLTVNGHLNEGGLAITPEDGDLTVVPLELVVQLPDGGSNVVIRQNGTDVEIYDANGSAVLARSPLAATQSVRVLGSDVDIDQVLVDYAFGGFFNLPGGIDVVGGPGADDVLTVTGTNNTDAVYSMAVVPAGQTLLTLSESAGSHEVHYSDFEDLTFDGMQTFRAVSTLSIGSNSLTLGSATPVDLGSLTTISGGTLSSSNQLALGSAESLIGFGTVSGRFAGEIGSLIELTGDLNIGDASNDAGFITLGEIDVGANTLTLLNANAAVLGSLTQLAASVAGTLNSTNGLLVDFGNNVTGFGTLNTPNDPTVPLMNNGSINGNSVAEPITLPGYVKGVGSINHVEITGTYSPGFSPAVVDNGSVTYGSVGTTIIEIGGTIPGTGHDQLNHSGVANLGGTLDVQLINNFTPSVGDSFVITTATGGINDTFAEELLPAAPLGSQWHLAYGSNQLELRLVDIVDVVDATLNGSLTNLNRSGIATLAVHFDQAVTVGGPSSLILRNHTIGQTIDLSSASISGNGTDTVIWNLLGVALQDGRYTAELPASEVADSLNLPMGATYAAQFLKRTGDMNGDGAVNFADYGVIGANFDPLPGDAYRAGDADGNGAVNFADYGVIAANFGPIPLASIQLDYGDAPESGTSYPTSHVNDGARHILGGTTYLGAGVDAEADGNPSANADSDGADEDGVVWGTLTVGASNTIDVTVASASSVFLNAWLDLNADGDWDDAGEHILDDVLANNGLNSLQIDIPANATAGATFARVRVTDTSGYGYRGLTPTGEVEDYQLSIAATGSSFGGSMPGGADSTEPGSTDARSTLKDAYQGDLHSDHFDVFFGDLDDEADPLTE